jgi:transcriptional antiterminator NusG
MNDEQTTNDPATAAANETVHGEMQDLAAANPTETPASGSSHAVAASDYSQNRELLENDPIEESSNQDQIADNEAAEAAAHPTSTEAPPAEEEPKTVVVKKARRTGPIEELPMEEAPIVKQWYILKIATNREDSIRDNLQRRVSMAGLDRYFGDILVPVELIQEFKNGKKKTTKRKLYPGYLVLFMEINDDTWYVVRETAGIGDFTGAMGRPAPMSASDIAKIIPKKAEEGVTEQVKVAIKYKQGDHVRIKEGTFANFEGNIDGIDEANGRVTVMVNIFGRTTPVDIEYWQVESV